MITNYEIKHDDGVAMAVFNIYGIHFEVPIDGISEDEVPEYLQSQADAALLDIANQTII